MGEECVVLWQQGQEDLSLLQPSLTVSRLTVATTPPRHRSAAMTDRPVAATSSGTVPGRKQVIGGRGRPIAVGAGPACFWRSSPWLSRGEERRFGGGRSRAMS